MDKASGVAMSEDEWAEDRRVFRKMTDLLRKRAPSMFMPRESGDCVEVLRFERAARAALAEAEELGGAMGPKAGTARAGGPKAL